MNQHEDHPTPAEMLISPGDLCELLKARFPWLGTDEEANGGDAVDALNALYAKARTEHLGEIMARAVSLRENLDDAMGEIEQFVGYDAEEFAPDQSEWAWEWSAEYLLARVAEIEGAPGTCRFCSNDAEECVCDDGGQCRHCNNDCANCVCDSEGLSIISTSEDDV